jgi:hypothetical protein
MAKSIDATMRDIQYWDKLSQAAYSSANNIYHPEIQAKKLMSVIFH